MLPLPVPTSSARNKTQKDIPTCFSNILSKLPISLALTVGQVIICQCLITARQNLFNYTCTAPSHWRQFLDSLIQSGENGQDAPRASLIRWIKQAEDKRLM